MGYCSPKCKKWTTIGVSIGFLILGIFLAAIFPFIIKRVLNYELSIASPSTIAYNMWKETPIPMYLYFYMFSWINVEECRKNGSVTPRFVEMGPYTFSEHHIRDNVTFNDNNTVTFYNRRIWKFLPEKSNGSLTDNVTTLNPVLASVANLIKDKHYLVQMAVNIFLDEQQVTMEVTRTVDEFIFKGYDDPMLTLLQKLNISGVDIPFKKMGWFVERNNTATYDGLFNMNDGGDTIDELGLVRTWNYLESVPYYDGECGKVNGTQGELWYPVHDQKSVKIFANDLCSSLELEHDGFNTVHGITGNQYVGSSKTFDNGTNYPEMKCFLGKGFTGQVYTGVRNVSLCKYGAPAFVSFPHFYLADPYYLSRLEGLHPDKEKHSSHMTIEPNTGLPLDVRVQVQINLEVFHLEHIKLLSKMETRFIPIFWFSETAQLTSDLSKTVKTVLLAPSVGQYTGYGVLALGLLIGAIGIVVTYRRGWLESEEQLLNPNEL